MFSRRATVSFREIIYLRLSALPHKNHLLILSFYNILSSIDSIQYRCCLLQPLGKIYIFGDRTLLTFRQCDNNTYLIYLYN